MTGFLAEAMTQAADRVERWRRQDLLQTLRRERLDRNARRGFVSGLRPPPRSGDPGHPGARPAVIAEFKRASPSRGAIASAADVTATVEAYAHGGASAISILTESRWFGGTLDDLREARRACDRPILRKDFVIDEYDLAITAAAGADAVLLIAACFEPSRLAELIACAGGLELDALVETHSERDVEKAQFAGATLIGVNARDLETLEVDVERALRLVASLDAKYVRVMESGLRSRKDVEAAREAGADAVLVGQHLMTSADPEAAVRALCGQTCIGLDDMARCT